MRANIGKLFVASFAASLMTALWAHSPAETNELVSAMLGNVLFFASDNWEDNVGISKREAPVTWPGFLGRDESHGWTLAEKKAAFDWYLSTLGTNDCTALRGVERRYVGIAVGQCRVLNYAEAVPSLKALALNPKGICRQDAIKLVIQFNSVDDATTAFVETIMTNSTNYNFNEQGAASAKYASRLLSFNATNAVQVSLRDAGVRMLYRNRLLESGTDSIIDKVFLKYIDGYGSSSNRLEYAINSFSHPKCAEIFGAYFTSVTNQLLSSGQPLPWINVGEGGN